MVNSSLSAEKSCVIITTGHFPEGDAGAVRLHMVAKALIAAGYSVSVLCRSKLKDSGVIDDIEYTSFRRMDGHKLVRALDYYLFPGRVKRYLRKNKDLSCVYIYNAHISVFNYCKKFCNKHGIRLVHDCVEWYSPEEFSKGEKSSAYKMKNKINTEIIDSSFSVIAISRFLEDYFSGKGIRTLRVPILCDPSEGIPPKADPEKLTLFYAGAPQKKDLVGNIFEATLLLTPEERSKLRIVLIGANKSYLVYRSGVSPETLKSCSGFLELCGRVPRDVVLQKMKEADFTVLPRDASLRYAKAGFPSKIVESLVNATPIICNYSSDLELYLTDGENAIVARDHTPEALAEAIRRALALSVEEKLEMSKKALESAETHFDYRKYADKLEEFLRR